MNIQERRNKDGKITSYRIRVFDHRDTQTGRQVLIFMTAVRPTLVNAGSQWIVVSWICSESTRLSMMKRLRSTAASGTMRITQFSFLIRKAAHS